MKKLFALVLALVMTMSLATVAWGAQTVSNLTDLQSAIANGETAITLDTAITITADTTIEAAAPVTITTSAVDAIVVTGGTLTLGENVTITSTTGAVLWAKGGDIVIAGATVTSSDSTSGYNYATATVSANSTLTVSKGELASTTSNAVAVDGGEVVITGTGKVTSPSNYPAAYSYNGGKITMDGGEASSLEIEDGGTLNVSDGTVTGVIKDDDEGNTGSITISGGTFSTLPDESYLADGYILVGNSVEKSSKKTNTYDGLYAKSTNDTSDNDPVAVDVVVTPAKAVKYNKTTGALEEAGYVEHVNITGDSTDYVFVNSLKEADVVLYKDAEGKFVKFYLDAIETPDYVEAVAFKNFGDDCGEVDYDEDDGYDKALKYFTIKGVEEFVLLEEAEEYACDFYVMYNSKLVPVVTLGLNKVEHKVVTESEDGELVKVYCSACGTQAVKAPNMMSVPKNAELVDGTGTEIWYWPVVGGSVSTETKVESAATFDAGIAMYVGMSVLAATGSAVVLKKREG